MVFHRLFLLWLGVLLAFSACTTAQVQTQVDTTGPPAGEVLTYKGPKARIAVASFKCKAAKCSGAIGEGLADMLATALFRTGRFIVLERGEGLEAIQKELNLGQSGYVRQGAAPQVGQMEGADILVVGAITAFEPEASGLGGGGIVIPYKIPLFGGAKFKKKEAYIAADIRLIDVRTSRVIAATTVEGKASSWKIGGAMGGLLGEVALGGALGAYRNTPMEKAIRVMLYRAVQAVAQMVPENYYRWGEGTQGYHTPPVTASVVRPTTSAPSRPTSSGGLVRASTRFKRGAHIVWKEDFSSCEEIPQGVRLVEGSAECVSYQGKKWIATVKDFLVFEKRLRRFNFAKKDWALEYTFFTKDYYWAQSGVILGSKNSPFKLTFKTDSASWDEQPIPIEGNLANAIHQVAIQKKGKVLRVFLDGKRLFSTQVDSLALSRLPAKIYFFLGSSESNIEEGKYTLLTDIVLSTY